MSSSMIFSASRVSFAALKFVLKSVSISLDAPNLSEYNFSAEGFNHRESYVEAEMPNSSEQPYFSCSSLVDILLYADRSH